MFNPTLPIGVTMVTKAIKPAALFLTALYLSGCASFSAPDNSEGKFVVQYGTLKLLEQSDSVTKDSIVEAVSDLRARIEQDEEARLRDIKQLLLDELGYQQMEPSDQLVVMQVMESVGRFIETGVDTDFVTDETRVTLLGFLAWVEEAARMYR